MRHPRRRSLTRRAAKAVALAVGAVLGAQAAAQDGVDLVSAEDRQLPVALVADEVSFDEAAGTVTARGNVEVYHGLRTLTASEIVYDSRADRISAKGPIVLRDGAGTALLADAAEIDAALRDGVVEGARAFIADGAGAMAAVEAQRVDGRYTALSRAVYSSCEVCAASPTPLWSIRARRIVHDEVERMVHYEDPTFEIMGVPVAWLPYFSHPDPTVERKSGFLAPTFLQSSRFGFGMKVPYFYVIDPSSDATFTAFPTTDDGFIGELEYRRRFDFGGFDAAGSLGRLDIGEGDGSEWRGHIFSEGRFDLTSFGFDSGTLAGFDLNLTTDEGYLRRYRFSDDDRLTSRAFVENWDASGFFSVAAAYFQSLRDNERTEEIPIVLPEFAARRNFVEGLAGGDLGVEASGVALSRIDGRDVRRLTAQMDWSREVIVPFGVALRGFGALRADAYQVSDDPEYDDGIATRFAPHAGVEARLPLIAYGAGATHLLEPGVQFVAAPDDIDNDDIPNEDSLLVEFDETNIFDVDRFPGYDRLESGSRLNLGVRYARVAEDPWRFETAVGRVFRFTEDTAFSSESGLAEERSDYVAAWTFGYDPYFLVSNRFRMDEELDLARNDVSARLRYGPGSLTGRYLFLGSDDTAGATVDREEFTLGAAYDVTPQWRIEGVVRRDLEGDRYVDAGGALTFRNECAQIELFVDRDFTDSENSEESTDIGLRVRIFGTADGGGARSEVCAQLQ